MDFFTSKKWVSEYQGYTQRTLTRKMSAYYRDVGSYAVLLDRAVLLNREVLDARPLYWMCGSYDIDVALLGAENPHCKTNEEWLDTILSSKTPDEEHCRVALVAMLEGFDLLVESISAADSIAEIVREKGAIVEAMGAVEKLNKKIAELEKAK